MTATNPARSVPLTSEWRPLAALADIRDAWRTLAERAQEPNVFYEPAFALAAAPAFGAEVGAIVVRDGSSPRDLVALLPLKVERRRHGLPVPTLTGWTHPFAPLGTPLIARGYVEPATAALCDHIAADAALPKLVLLPYVPQDGRFACALTAELSRRGLRHAALERHERAILAPGTGRAGYIERALDAKRRKELRRQRRRLADAGPVAVEMANAPAAMADILADFLALEAAGWKGRAGTAAAQAPAILEFLATAVAELAAEAKAGAARLTCGGRPVAASVVLRSGDTAWFWKIAYDESWAKCSPGVQLALDLTQALLDDKALARVDSCATANHPMIERLWRERMTLADLLFCANRHASRDFAIRLGVERLARFARQSARRVRNTLRRG